MSPKPPPPDDPDHILWQRMTQDVTPLQDPIREISVKPAIQKMKATKTAPSVPSRPAEPLKTGKGLDGRTAKRFEQGKIAIEGRIDLHGMTLPQAHASVRAFIQRHYDSGSRCVLVITGKGGREDNGPWYESTRGGIRRNFMQWLEAPDMQAAVLSVSSARPSHGGEGAFYVLLRRHRAGSREE